MIGLIGLMKLIAFLVAVELYIQCPQELEWRLQQILECWLMLGLVWPNRKACCCRCCIVHTGLLSPHAKVVARLDFHRSACRRRASTVSETLQVVQRLELLCHRLQYRNPSVLIAIQASWL